MAALILGILSLVLCFVPLLGVILAIVAIVLGVKGYKRAQGAGEGTTPPLIGAILGGVGVIAGLIGTISVGMGLAGFLFWSRAAEDQRSRVEEVRQEQQDLEALERSALERQRQIAEESLEQERQRAAEAALEAEAMRQGISGGVGPSGAPPTGPPTPSPAPPQGASPGQ